MKTLAGNPREKNPGNWDSKLKFMYLPVPRDRCLRALGDFHHELKVIN